MHYKKLYIVQLCRYIVVYNKPIFFSQILLLWAFVWQHKCTCAFCPSVYVLWFSLYDIFICCLAYRMNDSSLWPINLHNYLRSLDQSQRDVCHRFAWSHLTLCQKNMYLWMKPQIWQITLLYQPPITLTHSRWCCACERSLIDVVSPVQRETPL